MKMETKQKNTDAIKVENEEEFYKHNNIHVDESLSDHQSDNSNDYTNEKLSKLKVIHTGKRRKRVDIKYDIFCDICNKGFTRRFDKDKHCKTKHAHSSVISDSKKIINSDTSGDTAASLNVGTKSQIYNCKLCDKVYKQKIDLNTHLKRMHGVTKVRRKRDKIVPEYFCEICEKGFTRKHDMTKHRKSQHPEVPVLEENDKNERLNYLKSVKVIGVDNKACYKCEICKKVFKQSYSIMRHRTIHTGERAYICYICGKNYPSSNGLKRHVTQLHLGVKKYSCNICGKKFAANATRDEHMNIHTNTRPFMCDICGKSFKQKASLHTHKLFHNDIYRFSCAVCGKKFRRKTELKVHTWLHTGHKPHKCHLCPSSFRLSQDLKKHLRIHDNLNECVCSECGITFNQLKYLNQHKKTHLVHKTTGVLIPNIKLETGLDQNSE